jgi:hypothetical protein
MVATCASALHPDALRLKSAAQFLGAAIWRVRAAPIDGVVLWGITLLELVGSVCLVVGGRLASIIVFDRLPSAKNPAPALHDCRAKFGAAVKND